MIGAALAVAALPLAWFAARARLGARVRALAGVRLGVAERILANRVALRRALLGLLAGIVAGGLVAGAVGCAIGLASERVLRARAERGRARRLEEGLPEALRSITAAVRAGRSLPQALEVARDEAASPVRESLDVAVRRLHAGAPVDDALDAFARAAGSPSAALAAETLRTGRRAGGNLPSILDVAVESMAERERIARDRRAATAQARLSATVVGAMPAAFVLMVGPGARDQLAATLRDPAGWVLLGAGVALEAGGALWMRAMTRSR